MKHERTLRGSLLYILNAKEGITAKLGSKASSNFFVARRLFTRVHQKQTGSFEQRALLWGGGGTMFNYKGSLGWCVPPRLSAFDP